MSVPLVLLLVLGVVAVVFGGWVGLLVWLLAAGCGLAFAMAIDSTLPKEKS